MQYWLSILGALCKIIGAEVIITIVHSTGSIASHTEQLNWFLQAKAPGCGINNTSMSASENGGRVSGSAKPSKASLR
jgi:hypothetical protein